MPRLPTSLFLRPFTRFSTLPKTSSTSPPPPPFSTADFESFRFDNEKSNSMLGYTMEELYGKRYGIRHSDRIKSEINKDSWVFLLASVVTFFYFWSSRIDKLDDNDAWNKYVYRDMNLVREIPEH